MSHNVSSMNGIFIFLLLLLAFDLKCVNTADEVPAVTESSTTPEPEGTTGCPPPDFKISRPRTKSLTTEQPLLVTFETTQMYLPQDFSTEDLELVNTKKKESDDTKINNSGEQVDRNTQQDAIKVKENPFWFEEIVRDSEQHFHDSETVHHNTHHHRDNTRRAKRNHHKKSKQWRNYDNPVIERVLSRRSIVEEDYTNDELVEPTDVIGNIFNENDTCTEFEPSHYSTYNNNINNINDELILEEEKLEDDIKQLAEADEKVEENEEMENNQKHGKNRVKRKSGKTTSALNRPKSSSDSKSKSSSRKVHGQIDEEGTYMIDSEEEGVVSKEKDKDSEETDEDADHSQFREVSEVRFPAEVGPLGTHRLCKIKCIDSMWVGPLCAAGDQDESGQMKFEPLYKRCVVDQIPPNLLLSYKNVSVTLNWDLPHGHTLQARCADLGLYKLLGEAKVLCSNGLWAPKLPQCVPTTLLTNYSDDSPPSIRIKVGTGSAAYEPSGILAVLPGSTLHLDCMYPRRKGSPEWTWTGWFRQYLTGWSAVTDKNSDEKASRYRLTIKDIQAGDSGTYTCATPRGLTNSISLVVAVSQCPTMNEPQPPLSLRLEGIKLGQRAIYRCPMGYMLQGTENATCLASGNWSSPAPTCIPIQCPPLFLEDPHLSLTELNTSAWGRAVFRCSWGYRLSGPPGLECLASGHWSGPIPRCRAIQCPQPVIPLNGGIDGTSGTAFGQRRYAVGALLTFSCNEAHLLVGEASIVCTESGFWSHAPPFCKAQCVYPGDPPNGLIAPLKFHYDPGDFLTVQCRPGFVEHGQNGQPPDRPKCLSDGNWSSQVSQCKNYEEV